MESISKFRNKAGERKEVTLKNKNSVRARFGKENPGAANRMEEILGNKMNARQVELAVATQTGIPRLDLALYGGIAPGISEIFGAESSGKTALLGTILAAAQRQGKEVALCPTEDLDVHYWEALGVYTDKLLLLEAENMEDMAELITSFVREPNHIVGVDSITALRPVSKNFNGMVEVIDEYIAWLEAVSCLVDDVNNTVAPSSGVVVTSQVRTRKSADRRKMFAGGVETASRKIADSFVTRLELAREDVSEDRYTMVVNVITNVLGPPARLINLPVRKGTGVWLELDLIRVCAELGIIDKKGPWYSLHPYCQHYHGEEAAAQALVDLPWIKEYLLDSKAFDSYRRI